MGKRRNPIPVCNPTQAKDASSRLFGETDYDIPRFGFASAFVITLAFIAAYLVVPAFIRPVGMVGVTSSSLVGAILVGAAFAGTRHAGRRARANWRASFLEFLAVGSLSFLFLFIMNAQGV